ncbi:hypothetical protein QYM36_007529, partial [Artemia franciscana]
GATLLGSGKIHVNSDDLLSLKLLKERNPNLLIILSIGAPALTKSNFTSLTTLPGIQKVFIESIVDHVQSDRINGIEINWAWSFRSGNLMEHRQNLNHFTKELFAYFRENMIFMRQERSIEEIERTVKQRPSEALSEASTDVIMVTPTEESLNLTIFDGAMVSSTSVDNPILPQFSVKTPVIILRLPTDPEILVKNYDLKSLTRSVDLFVSATHNITTADELSMNMTYHHSRLMGSGDIQNTDSVLDLLISLGVPKEKIIPSIPTFGEYFRLANSSNNLPQSKSLGSPSLLTFRQICSIMKDGTWTVEREDDLTGSYAYRDDQWIAFDDDTTAKIKGKYFLLQELAGAAVFYIDADDTQADCGKEKYPITKALQETLSSFTRSRRSAVLESLEEDLLTLSTDARPVYYNNVKLSEYRITRIVDNDGYNKAYRETSEIALTCSRQGYFRNPENCNYFYRCVKFNQYTDDFTVFEYLCPEGLVFDENWEVCTWPSQTSPCDGSSEIRSVPKNKFICPGEGYYTDPENCRWFFACKDYSGYGELTQYEFRCPFGLVFDASNLICNWPWLVDSCSKGAYQPSYSSNYLKAEFASGVVNTNSKITSPKHQMDGNIFRKQPGTPGYLLGKVVNNIEEIAKDCISCVSNPINFDRNRDKSLTFPNKGNIYPSVTISNSPGVKLDSLYNMPFYSNKHLQQNQQSIPPKISNSYTAPSVSNKESISSYSDTLGYDHDFRHQDGGPVVRPYQQPYQSDPSQFGLRRSEFHRDSHSKDNYRRPHIKSKDYQFDVDSGKLYSYSDFTIPNHSSLAHSQQASFGNNMGNRANLDFQVSSYQQNSPSPGSPSHHTPFAKENYYQSRPIESSSYISKEYSISKEKTVVNNGNGYQSTKTGNNYEYNTHYSPTPQYPQRQDGERLVHSGALSSSDITTSNHGSFAHSQQTSSENKGENGANLDYEVPLYQQNKFPSYGSYVRPVPGSSSQPTFFPKEKNYKSKPTGSSSYIRKEYSVIKENTAAKNENGYQSVKTSNNYEDNAQYSATPQYPQVQDGERFIHSGVHAFSDITIPNHSSMAHSQQASFENKEGIRANLDSGIPLYQQNKFPSYRTLVRPVPGSSSHRTPVSKEKNYQSRPTESSSYIRKEYSVSKEKAATNNGNGYQSAKIGNAYEHNTQYSPTPQYPQRQDGERFIHSGIGLSREGEKFDGYPFASFSRAPSYTPTEYTAAYDIPTGLQTYQKDKNTLSKSSNPGTHFQANGYHGAKGFARPIATHSVFGDKSRINSGRPKSIKIKKPKQPAVLKKFNKNNLAKLNIDNFSSSYKPFKSSDVGERDVIFRKGTGISKPALLDPNVNIHIKSEEALTSVSRKGSKKPKIIKKVVIRPHKSDGEKKAAVTFTEKVAPLQNLAFPQKKESDTSYLSEDKGSVYRRPVVGGAFGFKPLNETLPSESCSRPGLFRHPEDCRKFYECYYDRWIQKYTLHIFSCPIKLVYDEEIYACNWPFQGPQCIPNQPLEEYDDNKPFVAVVEA